MFFIKNDVISIFVLLVKFLESVWNFYQNFFGQTFQKLLDFLLLKLFMKKTYTLNVIMQKKYLFYQEFRTWTERLLVFPVKRLDWNGLTKPGERISARRPEQSWRVEVRTRYPSEIYSYVYQYVERCSKIVYLIKIIV